MTLKLNEEIRQAIAEHPGQVLQVEDPVTHACYVLIELQDFKRLQRAQPYDTTEPDQRDFYPAFSEAVKDDLDAPGMELYESGMSPPEKP